MMNGESKTGLSDSSVRIDDLARRLALVEPAALLVRPRLLRRVVKRDRQIPGLGLRVPHATSYTLTREALLRAARLDELGLEREDQLAAVVLLLPRPGPIELRPGRVGQTLQALSRRLLHAALHREVRQRRVDGFALDERIAALGEPAWEEIRTVLAQERLLLPPATPADVYEEFACVFLELAYHAPHLLPRWFPALADLDAVRAALEADFHTAGLGERMRLPGTPPPDGAEDADLRPDEVVLTPSTAGMRIEELLAQAEAKGQRGNLVRSAILRARAGETGPARETLGELARRLVAALHQAPDEARQWQAALEPLLEPAARGSWTRSGRFLYDLQTVCEDREKPFFAVDLVEWLVRFGGPLRRPLPAHGEVLSCKHLRRALGRVPLLPVSEEERAGLYKLLADALEQAEQDVRDAFRPRLEEVLRSVGFTPRNHAEELARKKVVAELVEGIVERGYLNLGDLRDAIARNRLKLGDLAGPGEFLTGDALLKANAALPVALDGVYRRGEVYLRWLQSGSSLLFGTVLGRVLTLFLILPLLGSFLTLKFAEEIAHFFSHVELLTTESLVGLALVILLLIHSADFRRLGWRLLHGAAWGLYWLFVGLPRALLRWPPVRWLLQSTAFLLVVQLVLKPAVVALPAGGLAWLLGASDAVWLGVLLGAFVLAQVLLNSRYGEYAEDLAADAVLRTWALIHENVLVGLFRYLIDLFRAVVERVDRIFYSVDEWLRYRPGDGRGSLVVKAALGTVWWAVTYVFRFAFVVLVEPQVNPIKHFPVVTVGHKVLLLAIDPTARALEKSFGIPYLEAAGAVTVVFALIPGVFGFLAWELMENWRLYRANQSPTLDPVRVGSHGETVRGLLRPGFHSGTVPKLYARLRHLPERLETPRLRRARDGLHHVEEDVAQFVRRDLLDALHGTKMWRDRVVLRVGHVRLDTRRIRVSIHAEGLGDGPPVVLVFEQAGPWLVFRVEEAGWVGRLKPDLALLWRDALIGFCKHAGVQVTAAQLARALPAGASWRIDEDGLEVRGADLGPARYDLDAEALVPRGGAGWPTLEAGAARFDAHPVAWAAWVEVWQRAQKGSKPAELLPGVAV